MSKYGLKNFFVIFLTIHAFLLSFDAIAGESGDREVITIPKTPQRPDIDGRLSEETWKNAVIIEEFFQYTPHNGAEPTEKTIAYLMYDQTSLYVGLRCFDSEPEKIRATLTPRNQWQTDDNAFIYIDTYDNKRESFLFQINPLGVQKNSFDTIWRSAAKIDSLGWTGEMAIPFKSLRFPAGHEQSWGIVIGRNIYRKGEIINSVDCRYEDDFYAMFTKAEGIENVSYSHNLEILPYGAMRYSGGRSFSEKEAALGVDVKLGLATNLVLDVSFAPDFSQVESDQFFVNFSPYEYQLAENRPFFNEGASHFTLPYSLLYSRRIENPKVMGKITGKEGSWRIGALTAWDAPLNGQEKGIYAFRVQKDVFSTSKIGMMASGFESGRKDYNRNIAIDGQFSNGAEHHFQFELAGTYNSHMPRNENFLVYMIHRIQKVEGINYILKYLDIGPNYLPQTGIIGLTGFRTPQLMLGYRWHLPSLGLEYISCSAVTNYSAAYSGLKIGQTTGTSLAVGTINKLYASLDVSGGETRSQIYQNDQLQWNRNIYPFKQYSFTLGSATGSFVDATLSYSNSQGPVYTDEFAAQEKGVDQRLTFGLVIKPLPNVILKNSDSFFQQRLDREGEVLYETWLLNNSIHYQLSRKIFSRIIQQLDTRNKYQQIDFLIGYEFFAGSTFYISYKELRNYYQNWLGRENYMIFGKMSYLFRI